MATNREQERLAKLAAATQAIYDRQAPDYDQKRDKSLFEHKWLERVVQDVARGGKVLDLGCGAGDPIGVWLHDQAFDVTGSDFSRDMLTLFAARIPGAKTVFSDMRDLSLPDRFDAIIGWGSFFHLTRDEQRTALPKIAKHLAPGGRLLLTVGPGEGEATGHVGHDEVFHASLSETAYRDLLEQNGCCVEAFVREDPECRGFTLLLARANALGATI
ncbi:MAG: class I SAM-dependent DNA methyltransferase [Pelagimonas sp.]|uniref:class I SAM-dependent DNA methyltransferase n=1 Tax=Pelagimonas sp. TaxID=2073170 RepID=UPI003D6ACC30